VQFDETEGPRAEQALQQLSDGKPVSFRGLGLQLSESGSLECRVYSRWAPENVDERIATEELSIGKGTLDDLLNAAPLFSSLIASKPRTWELVAIDGPDAIRLCRLEGETLRWNKGWPRRA
jgi:hypothetical protein